MIEPKENPNHAITERINNSLQSIAEQINTLDAAHRRIEIETGRICKMMNLIAERLREKEQKLRRM